MSTHKNRTPPTVIEIEDSSGDEEKGNEIVKQAKRHLAFTHRSASVELPTTSSAIDSIPMEMCDSSQSEVVKKIHNRRKSVHHSIRSMENISFESVSNKRKESESERKIAESKKRQWVDGHIKAAIDDNIDDPEMKLMLRKIAYCRVFSNYLLRQYDMLSIDFKLYSNIDLLMLDLKKRVDIYVSIRKSRQQLHMNVHEGNKSIRLD